MCANIFECKLWNVVRRGHIWWPLASWGSSQPGQDLSPDAEAISGSRHDDDGHDDDGDDCDDDGDGGDDDDGGEEESDDDDTGFHSLFPGLPSSANT